VRDLDFGPVALAQNWAPFFINFSGDSELLTGFAWSTWPLKNGPEGGKFGLSELEEGAQCLFA